MVKKGYDFGGWLTKYASNALMEIHLWLLHSKIAMVKELV